MQEVVADTAIEHSTVVLLPTLLDALRRLSVAPDSETLLRELMRVLLDYSGAAHAVLMLPEDAGLTIRARADAGAKAPRIRLVSEPLEGISDTNHQLPLSVVRYAIQAGRTVVLTAGAYPVHLSGDPYLRLHEPSAVLCMPLWLGDQLLGVIYLEHLAPFAALASGVTNPTTGEPISAVTADMAVGVELLGMRALLIWGNAQLRAKLLGSNVSPAEAVGATVAEPFEFTIHLLGQRRFVHRGTEVTPMLQERMQVLLALLLLSPQRAVPRSQLAQVLWPEASVTQGYTNLRNLIFKLRQCWPGCADLLAFDRKVLAWRDGVALGADVVAFQRAVVGGVTGTGLMAQQALERAAVLYQGELLPGLPDEALATPRERLHDQYLMVLDRLVTLQTEHGGFALALRHAQQLQAADPLRETSYHHLIRLHALLGDTASARRAYEACLSMLYQEFGAPPSERTEMVFAQYVER